MANRIYNRKAEICANTSLGYKYYKLVLSSLEIARISEPGQFLQIKVNNGYTPLLRRPFSICRIDGSHIEIIYEIIGKGTQILSQKKKREYLDIIGPLGKGFTYRSPAANRDLPVLVAGGMGMAPLFFLAERLKAGKRKNDEQRPIVLIGAKTKDQILCERELKQLGWGVKISTDDGSRGFKGKVTELLKKILDTGCKLQVAGCRHAITDMRSMKIYACGPRSMLKEICRLSEKYNIPAEISLEEHMACGIGVCLGCVVNTKKGYNRVCKEGPVFEAKEIIW